jgi:hypothetical protein
LILVANSEISCLYIVPNSEKSWSFTSFGPFATRITISSGSYGKAARTPEKSIAYKGMQRTLDALHVAGPTSGKSNIYLLVRGRIFS